jgi:hypothetical protein
VVTQAGAARRATHFTREPRPDGTTLNGYPENAIDEFGCAFYGNGLKTGDMKNTKASSFGILTIIMALAVQVQAQAPFTNSLVAYYPFNGNANDATGHGNNGQIIGTVVPATDRFGIASNAYYFNGSASSAIEITNTLFNIGQAGYTISGWFATSNINIPNQLLFNSVPETGIGIAFNDGEPLVEFAVGACNGSWTDIPIQGTLTDYTNQTWYQFALTKNGTTYTLYTNGQVSCQAVISAASNFNYNVSGIIGSITPINPPYLETFLGALDDFRIYNRALSTNEVQELYAYESVAPPCTNPYPATATAYVTNGFVIGATITDGGCGYTNTPLVLIEGGSGTGAAATAAVSNGMVTGITITDAGSNYTSTTAIYIYFPLSISAQPQSLVVNAYDTASFGVTASGTPPLSYQWSLNGTNIVGATSGSLTISNVVQTNLGTYAVVLTDPFGLVASSNAVLSMYPILIESFDGAVTYWGKSATFGVEAWGSDLSIQWFDNGVAISGATNQTLDFPSIQLTNAGRYTVVVSSPLGSVTNTPEAVVVNPAGVSLGLYPGVTISGVVGYNYIIQTTTDLSNTNSWVTLTNLTLTQPVQIWVDTNSDASLPANPYRFYQVLPGQ